jgi:hypothetical protein
MTRMVTTAFDAEAYTDFESRTGGFFWAGAPEQSSVERRAAAIVMASSVRLMENSFST